MKKYLATKARVMEEKARVINETADKMVKDFVDSMGW